MTPPWTIEEYLTNASFRVWDEETNIDDSADIYLITWSPDPARLPDCDPDYQHRFNVNLLADYLKFCYCGIFCHEFSQLGNPHYHGWYQICTAPNRDRGRVVMIKVLQNLVI